MGPCLAVAITSTGLASSSAICQFPTYDLSNCILYCVLCYMECAAQALTGPKLYHVHEYHIYLKSTKLQQSKCVMCMVYTMYRTSIWPRRSTYGKKSHASPLPALPITTDEWEIGRQNTVLHKCQFNWSDQIFLYSICLFAGSGRTHVCLISFQSWKDTFLLLRIPSALLWFLSFFSFAFSRNLFFALITLVNTWRTSSETRHIQTTWKHLFIY